MDNRCDVIVAYTHNMGSGGIRVKKLPKPGETVRAIGSSEGIDAAKGTNVSVAASRMGAYVALVAHVSGGDWFVKADKFLQENNVNNKYVICDNSLVSIPGCMIIDEDGNNMIVLGSSEPQKLSVNEIEQAFEDFHDAKYCVTGYELDECSVKNILAKAKQLNIKTILNPSPVPVEKPDYWDLVDILVLNEVETIYMLNMVGVTPSKTDWVDNAKALVTNYGCQNIVITLGADGYTTLSHDGHISFGRGISVQALDTTGAGDSFLGVLAARLSAGDTLEVACKTANIYAACTVQKFGTVSSYPYYNEMKGVL